MFRENPENKSPQENQEVEDKVKIRKEMAFPKELEEVRKRFSIEIEENVLNQAKTIVYAYLIGEMDKMRYNQETKKIVAKLADSCQDIQEEKDGLDLRGNLLRSK